MKQIADLAEVIHLLPPGTVAVLHSGCAEPPRLSRELAANAAAIRGVRLYTMMPMGSNPPYAATPPDSFAIATFFPGKGLRAAVSSGRAELVRTPLSGIPKLFRGGSLRANVLLLQLSSPDAQGWMSLGVSVDYMRAVLDQNPIVIAEINPRMPRTCGDTLVHESQVRCALSSDQLPQPVPGSTPDAVDRMIAGHVAGLLFNGAVLQAGIGTLPDAVLGQLTSLRRLGIHSGIITDALLPLLKQGIITNETKTRFAGRCVTTMAAGSQEFYDALDGNAAVEFHPCSVTHDLATLAAIDNLCAINSVLQIDLSGRANAERIGGRTISGPGGLPDFARGATLAPGGISIVALRAATKDASTSNIVPALAPDAATTVTTADIDYVVTEHGVARVRGLTGTPLADALAGIAHPDFRADLRRQAGR